MGWITDTHKMWRTAIEKGKLQAIYLTTHLLGDMQSTAIIKCHEYYLPGAKENIVVPDWFVCMVRAEKKGRESA